MAGGLGNIGSASVTVEGDFSRFFQQLQTEGKRAPDITVDVQADTSAARREIESMDSTNVEIDATINEVKLQKQFKDSGGGGGDIAAIEFGKSFSKRIGSLDLGGRIFKTIKPVAFVAAVGLAAQAASAAAAGILALTASLGTLSGLLVSAPAVLLSFSQAMVVTKLSLSGVTDALGGLGDEIDKKKLAKLTPEAQAFVRELDRMKPAIISLQRALQAQALPGFTKAVKDAAPALETLRGPLEGTARTLGDLAQRAGKALTDFIGPIRTLLTFNNRLISSLGDTGIVLAKSLIDVLVTARPIILFVVGGINSLANALGDNIRNGIASGGLREFFERMIRTTKLLGRLLGPLGSILASVFEAALPFGNHLIALLAKSATGFANFLKTVEGKVSLTNFFAQSMPAIIEVGQLVRDLSKAFLDLGSTPGLAGVIKTVREELLPVLVDLVTVTTRDFLPVLLPALVSVTQLFLDLSGTTGPLNAVVKTIGFLAAGVHSLFENVPGAKTVVSSLLTISALGGLASIAIGLSGIASAFRFIIAAGGIVGILEGVAAALIALALNPVVIVGAAMIGIGVAMKKLYDSSKLARDGINFFSKAMTDFIPGLGPFLEGLSDIALKLTGVKGAADKLTLNSVNVEFAKFRKSNPGATAAELHEAYLRLGGTARTTGTSIKAASDVAVPAITAMGQATKDAAAKAVESKSLFAGFTGAVAHVLTGLGGLLRKVADSGRKALKALGDQARVSLAKQQLDATKNGIVGLSASLKRFAPNALAAALSARFLGLAFVFLRGTVNALRLAFASLATGMLRSLVVAQKFAPAVIGSVLSIRTVLAGISFHKTGQNIMNTLLSGLRAGFASVKIFIAGIAAWIEKNKGPISADRKLLVPAGHAIMSGFDSGLKTRWNPVRNWVQDIGSFFKGAVNANAITPKISDILLGKGGTPKDLSNILAAKLGIPAGFIGAGPLGFLHPTSGWGDTLAQGKLIDRIFGSHMGSGLRSIDTVAGPGVSQHLLGQAIDWGDASNSHALLSKMSAFMSRFGNVFKQVIWQNSLWKGGHPGFGFVPDHMDHMHLGWQPRAAGGSVQKGRAYQWNERGREMFMPQQNGYVMNAGRTKELVSAIKTLAQRGGNNDNRSAQIHVHSNAIDPAAVGGIVMSNLGGAFSLA